MESKLTSVPKDVQPMDDLDESVTSSQDDEALTFTASGHVFNIQPPPYKTLTGTSSSTTASATPKQPDFRRMAAAIRDRYKDSKHVTARDKHEIQTVLAIETSVGGLQNEALYAHNQRILTLYNLVLYGWATAAKVTDTFEAQSLGNVEIEQRISITNNYYKTATRSKPSRGRGRGGRH